MQLFYVQILMFIFAFLYLNLKKVSIQYYFIFLIPFTSTGLFWIEAVTAQILPYHIIFALVLVKIIISGHPLSTSSGKKMLIMLAPFLIALAYNYFFFSEVQVWGIQREDRQSGWRKLVTKTSLSYSNFTQLAYLILCLLVYWVYSSIPLDKSKIKKVIDTSLWVVVFAAIFQLATYYTNTYQLYEALFYPLHDRVGLYRQVIHGLKRINAVAIEPSYFAYYLFYTLVFYLLFFGKNSFKSSLVIKFAVLVGLLSTATTFYYSFIYLLLIYYIFHTERKYKLLVYVIAIFLTLYILNFQLDFLENYLQIKQKSTNERYFYGWTNAIKNIIKSPIFGLAYGTDRPFFIYTQLPSAIGFLGTAIFVYGVIKGTMTKQKKLYLFAVLWLGIAFFELVRVEMWFYYALIVNPHFLVEKNKYTIQNTNRALHPPNYNRRV